MKVKPGELATGMWAPIELASLVARKVRMGELSLNDADAVRRELRRILAESFDVLLPSAADYATAASFLEMPKINLRAGDAFHLAIAAKSWCQEDNVAGSRIHQGRQAIQAAGGYWIEARRLGPRQPCDRQATAHQQAHCAQLRVADSCQARHDNPRTGDRAGPRCGVWEEDGGGAITVVDAIERPPVIAPSPSALDLYFCGRQLRAGRRAFPPDQASERQ